MSTNESPTVVLVHGGFVDGSGWQGVYDPLTRRGFNVAIVQNPTLSLDGDVAATNQVLDAQDGPVVLVGHSYGGAVITEAGNARQGRGARVHRRVRPRQGRVGQHADRGPAAGRAGPADPAAASTASCSSTARSSPPRSPPTCRPEQAAFMADSQVPWGVDALSGAVTEPAWRNKPSWYLVAVRRPHDPTARRSARWPSAPAPLSPRCRPATPSTSPSRAAVADLIEPSRRPPLRTGARRCTSTRRTSTISPRRLLATGAAVAGQRR